MLYNKNQFKKVNDKKVLHKIKKHWVTLSIAMIGLISGGAVTTAHVSANSNTHTQNDNDQAANHSLDYNQSQNRQLKLINNDNNVSGYNVQNNLSIDNAPIKSVNITKQVNNLHNHIVTNALNPNESITQSKLLGNANDNDSYVTSAGQFTSKSTSTSASKSTNVSLSTNTSTSINTHSSLSDSTTTSMSKSANIIDALHSASISASISESNYASSAYAAVLASGGHVVAVSPSVRSAMLSGAAEVASYNQTDESNEIATIKYLNDLQATNSLQASEKTSAENYVRNFYINPQNRNAIITTSEAAQGIKLWGNDPRFFTIFKSSPNSIVNNVVSFYEPTASNVASLTGSVANHLMSLATAEQATQPSSESAALNNNISSMFSTANSYDRAAASYIDVINTNLDSLNVSDNSSLATEKNNALIYASQDAVLISENNSMIGSLDNQANTSDMSHNSSFISDMNGEVSAASEVDADASLIVNDDVNPIDTEASNDDPNSSSIYVAPSLSTSVSNSASSSLSASYSVNSTNSSMNSYSYTPTQQSATPTFSMSSSSVVQITSGPSSEFNSTNTATNVNNEVTTSNTSDTDDISDNAVPVQEPIHWFYVTDTCLAHNHLSSVGKVKDYSAVLHPGTVAKIVKTFKVKYGHRSFIRYEIRVNGKNYFVTGNNKFTKNEYIQPKELKHNRKAIIQVPCFMYDSPIYSNYHRIRKMHRGQVVTIKRIIHIGKKGHFMTRFELTNGLFVTSNRKFIKMI